MRENAGGQAVLDGDTVSAGFAFWPPCDLPDCAVSTYRSLSFARSFSYSLTTVGGDWSCRRCSRWVGRAIRLGLASRFCEIAICEDRVVRSAGRVVMTPEGLEALAASLESTDPVALEVSGGRGEVMQILEPRVERVIVVRRAARALPSYESNGTVAIATARQARAGRLLMSTARAPTAGRSEPDELRGPRPVLRAPGEKLPTRLTRDGACGSVDARAATDAGPAGPGVYRSRAAAPRLTGSRRPGGRFAASSGAQPPPLTRPISRLQLAPGR